MFRCCRKLIPRRWLRRTQPSELANEAFSSPFGCEWAGCFELLALPGRSVSQNLGEVIVMRLEVRGQSLLQLCRHR